MNKNLHPQARRPAPVGVAISDAAPEGIPNRVRELITRRLDAVIRPTEMAVVLPQLVPGKMLRTRLASRLAGLSQTRGGSVVLEHTCAATEMVHTASLLHDDVIDRGLIRRSQPTVWRTTSPSIAVLVGDVLLCEAIALLARVEGGRYVEIFVDKVREVCRSEAEQELLCRGTPLDAATCLRLARGKTGPLFGFVGRVCGGENPTLALVLEEVGYRIGTAYQIADDLLDIIGEESVAGKTLGTDMTRGKFTLAVARQGHSPDTLRPLVSNLCVSALRHVEPWPEAHEAVLTFLRHDLQGVFEHCALGLDVCEGVQT